MFPEGTRTSKKELLPIQKGAFHLALVSRCPIQPVVVSRYSFLGKRKFDNGHMKIRLLPTISTEGQDNMDTLIEEAYKVMSENADTISDSCQTNNSLPSK
nr:unnamed protein product [Callosobruchus chinensis]